MTWDICSKAGEDCPFHDRYVKISTRRRNLKPIRFEFMTDPQQKVTIKRLLIENMETVNYRAREIQLSLPMT